MFALLILPSAALAWRPAPGYVFHFKDDSKDSPTKELINYYKEPALPVSLLTAWLSLSGSHLKGDFLKPSTFAWLSLSGSHLSGSFLQTAKQLALAPALEPLAIMIHGPRFNFHISVFAKTLVWRYDLQECNGTEIWCDSGYYTGSSGDQCWYGNYCMQLVCKYLNY